MYFQIGDFFITCTCMFNKSLDSLIMFGFSVDLWHDLNINSPDWYLIVILKFPQTIISVNIVKHRVTDQLLLVFEVYTCIVKKPRRYMLNSYKDN